MSVNRRQFIELLLASGASPALSQIAGAMETQEETGETGNSQAFWSNYYKPARRGSKPAGMDEDRRVSYLHYSPQGKKLRFAQEIPAEELIHHEGDVAVSMNVTGIRLSQKDHEKFKNISSAQLRLDLAQNKSMLDIMDKLAWASVAALFVGESKTPNLQDLSFTPESTKDVYLPGGTGLLGVNVSMVHRESRMYQLLQVVVKDVGRFAPVIGLPAISVAALAEFNQLYGKIEHRTTFLFQTPTPQKIFATRPAREEAETSAGINLVSGDYILIPQEYVNDFQPHREEFKLVEGYMVAHNADEGQSVYQLASNITPDISYVAVNIKVTPPWGTKGAKPSTADNPASTIPATTNTKTETKKPAAKKP